MADSKRCLVTGGAGFIGSHIVDLLLANGHTVSVLDNLSTGKQRNVPAAVGFYQLDLRDDLTPVFERERPQIVFHHAAQVSVSVSTREPEQDAHINILGTIRLLEACKKYGVERIMYASSCAAYGEPLTLPMREDDPPLAMSPYGISKYTVERYLYYYRRVAGLDYVALRYANVYGPRQDPHGEAGAVAIFSQRLLSGEEAYIFGDGEQTRDFVYVKDVARANLAAMAAAVPDSVMPVFNVGTCQETNVNTLFDIIKKYTGSDQPRIYKPYRPGDVLHAYLANDKIKSVIGWQPQTDIDTGLKETVEFFKNDK